ncbi:hypothetical protein GCM10007079_11840 [Nocardiopsis terrae]|uniref:DUF4350 domain-containing protein n=1 Tax=Nocardiopsis terrae TaxID=372655 RepID=A0ABR9HC53_9ACTN|nr:DUF4350 domain-containing protein [Nocardiopsis terrae]MBE1456605.1 hypothetical protein [Nocardiopsis terrae]GHC75990.1 hypothetical protein GCM10007079_11840 [Nocardiopsis terrae]
MTTTAPPEHPPAGSAPGSAAGRLWRAGRAPAAVIGLLVAVSVLLSLGSEQFPSGHLEPGSPEPDGARALVRLLDEDSDLTVARTSEAAVRAVERSGEDTVLVVLLDHRLLPEELDTLAGLGSDTVLVRPSLRSLAAFAPGADMTGRVDDERTLEPGCALPAAASAGDAGVTGELYTAGNGVEALGCYPAADGSGLLQVAAPDGSTTTVLGTGDPLTNRELDSAGNAALALNLLSAEDVVWLRPDVPEEVGSATLWELVPAGVRWSLAPLALTLLLFALWRGRRMGALVPESLPALVRASETTEGRAGLYQSRKARDRAASALRNGFLERSVPKLGLRTDSGPDSVVAAAAARSGEDPQDLWRLLYPSQPDPYTADDEAMLRLADELDRLSGRLR